MKNKRGDSKYILLILIVIGSLFALYYFNRSLPQVETDNTNNWVQKSEWEKTQENKEIINNNNQVNTNQENSNAQASNGGGGSSSKNSGTSCEIRKISYSIKTIDQSEECIEFNEGECIKKEISCSAEIVNDDSITQIFEMELIFVPDGKNKDIFGFSKKEETFTLSPGEDVVMQGDGYIENSSEENLADLKINCFFNTIEELEQEVCT